MANAGTLLGSPTKVKQSMGYRQLTQTLNDHRRRTATKWTKRLPNMMAAFAGRLHDEGSPQQISGFMAPLAGVIVSHHWIYSLI